MTPIAISMKISQKGLFYCQLLNNSWYRGPNLSLRLCSAQFSGALSAPKSTSKNPEFSHRFPRFETILFFRPFGF